MEGVGGWGAAQCPDLSKDMEQGQEAEPTLYEELQEERTTVDFEERSQTWRKGA